MLNLVKHNLLLLVRQNLKTGDDCTKMFWVLEWKCKECTELSDLAEHLCKRGGFCLRRKTYCSDGQTWGKFLFTWNPIWYRLAKMIHRKVERVGCSSVLRSVSQKSFEELLTPDEKQFQTGLPDWRCIRVHHHNFFIRGALTIVIV